MPLQSTSLAVPMPGTQATRSGSVNSVFDFFDPLHSVSSATPVSRPAVNVTYTQLNSSLLSATAASFVPTSGTASDNSSVGRTADPLAYTNIRLAESDMKSISKAIEKDLCAIELEIATTEPQGEAYIRELKDYCSDIERRVKVDYKEACKILARLDLNIAMQVMDSMNNSSESYLDRIRLILVNLRKARSSLILLLALLHLHRLILYRLHQTIGPT